MGHKFPFLLLNICFWPATISAQQPRLPSEPAARPSAQRVSWRVRTLVGDDRLLQWRIAVSATATPKLSFKEAVAIAAEAGLNAIEGSAVQKVSPDLAANLDYKLSEEQRTSVREVLKSANIRMAGYQAGSFPPGAEEQKKVLEFAKGLGAETVIGSADVALLRPLEKLANELAINVALQGRSDPASGLAGLEGLSSRIGLAVDIGAWLARGVKPVPALARLQGRIHAIDLRDRSGAAGVADLFLELNRMAIRPLLLTIAPSRAADPLAGLTASAEDFERAVQAALGAFVVTASKSMPIRGPRSLPEEVKARIDAAIPRQAYVKPKRPRKLLVIDACVAGMTHNTIPHFNLAVELMAKHTGAFEAIFDNDLDNLKWPRIKQFDAVYLNDTVGELLPDPEVRASLLRYVREGGGIGGWHGSTWASRSWRELGEMIGAMDAPHRIETAYIRLDDPHSAINRSFDGTGLQHTEEYYRFHHAGPTGGFYSRDKLHVLLSLDTERSPEFFKPGRDGKPFFQRPDNDYAVAWIRSYGKGRVYYNSMGHMAETMMSKQIMGHVFAAIQFVLGDLDADTTPSSKLGKK